MVQILYFGGYTMTTTGELRAIIEDLELVDAGDAASYLGEEAANLEALPVSETAALGFTSNLECVVKESCTPCHV